MKRCLAIVVLLTLLNAASLFLGHPQAVHAQLPPGIPVFITTAVTTVGGCPTPSFANTSAVAVICSDTQDVYISTLKNPTPAKLQVVAGAAGIQAQGSVTPGDMLVWVDSTHAKDGGAVPVVPLNIVTSPVSIPTGHLMVAGTNALNAVDGGPVPTVPGNLVTFTGTPVVGDSLKWASTTGVVTDSGLVEPNFSNLGTGISCPSAALSGGKLICPAGSSIQ